MQRSAFLCSMSIFLSAWARETRLRKTVKVSPGATPARKRKRDSLLLDAVVAEAPAESPVRRDLLGRGAAGDCVRGRRGQPGRQESEGRGQKTHLAVVAGEEHSERELGHTVWLEVPVARADEAPKLATRRREEQLAELARRAREADQVRQGKLAADLCVR